MLLLGQGHKEPRRQKRRLAQSQVGRWVVVVKEGGSDSKEVGMSAQTPIRQGTPVFVLLDTGVASSPDRVSNVSGQATWL